MHAAQQAGCVELAQVAPDRVFRVLKRWASSAANTFPCRSTVSTINCLRSSASCMLSP
jgi:hypothetical protein